MAKKNNKRKEKTFYISGMHCASCKKIIEEQLVGRKDIYSASVNLSEESVVVVFEKETVNASIFTKEFFDAGYIFSDDPSNTFDYKKLLASLVIAAIIFFLLLQSEKLVIMSGVSADENSSIITFFVLGIVASLSSCVALVGGIILSMTKNWSNESRNMTLSRKMEPHIKLHIGRLFAYVIGGGVLGILGSFITFNSPFVYAILILIVSVVMLLVGLQMLGVRWVMNIFSHVYESTFGKIVVNKNIKNKSPFVIGASTFFLPCGFTLIAQGAALASGDFVKGATIMGIFAVGTLPVLMGVSFGGVTLLGKKRYASIFNFIIGTIIIVFALYTINGQLNVLGLPSFSDIRFSSSTSYESDNSENEEGKITQQELHIIADGFEYTIVGSNTLTAGVPTKMIVDNQGIAGCGAYMAARGLLDDWIALKTGINEVEFTPNAGTYKITCTMGMVPPVTVIVK